MCLAIIHFLVVGPISIPAFMGGTAFLRTLSLEKTKENIEAKTMPALIFGIKFWPILNFVCY